MKNLEQFVLNFPKTELLDSTLFISIYDFVKFDIEKCMKIGEKLYWDIEDDPEDKKLILRKHSSVSKKIGNLKNLDFWNRLSNLNFCLMDKEDMTLMNFEGFFFVKNKKKPLLHGENICEYMEFSTFAFKVKVEVENKFSKYTGNDTFFLRKSDTFEHDILQRQLFLRKIDTFEQDILQRELFNFIKNKWDVYDTDRANDFLGAQGAFLIDETKHEDILEWNRKFLKNLTLQDLQFLTKLKTQIEKRHLYMNHQNHAYNPWDARGFIFGEDGVLVIFHER